VWKKLVHPSARNVAKSAAQLQCFAEGGAWWGFAEVTELLCSPMGNLRNCLLTTTTDMLNFFEQQ
jgi:hypothetical protein